MMRCDHCQSVMLDHLYGLLDPAEAAAVEEHLSGCAGCSAARDQAARLQGLFARAAKVEFPHVRFDPPTAEPKSDTPSTLPFRARWHRGAWLPWAVAAAVLVMVGAVALPVRTWMKRHDAASREYAGVADRAKATRVNWETARDALAGKHADAHRNYQDAKQAHDAILADWLAAEKAAAKADADRKLTVQVIRPAAVQPGAPNDFVVYLRDKGNTIANARVEAEFRDDADAVLFRQPLNPQRADTHPVRLPAEVWTRVKPEAELFLVVAAVDEKTGTRTELVEKVRLFGPVYATMLATDKPAYRPGETVYFRSLTLDRVTFRPPARPQHLRYELRRVDIRPTPPLAVAAGSTELARVAGGAVETVLGPDGLPLRGVGCEAFVLPPDLAEGEYTLVLHELPGPAGLPPAITAPVTRTIKVRSGAPEKFQKRVGFSAASYSAGATVEVWCEIKQQDKPVAGAGVSAAIRAADQPVRVEQIFPVATGDDGRVTARFTLPQNVFTDDVWLTVTFFTPQGQEQLTERVPVIGRKVHVEFFPEGGKLVAGVPNKVYVRATTPTGKPVDVRGTITDGKQALARVETVADRTQPGVNRGLGSFTFTPQLGTPCWLALEHPAGMFAPILDIPVHVGPAAVVGVAGAMSGRSGFAVPEPAVEGVVMTVLDPITGPGQPVRVHLVAVGRPRKLVVGAYTRGRITDTRTITVEPGRVGEVQLLAGGDTRGGVTRITVFENPNEGDGVPTADLVPVAERLVFRTPGEHLKLGFTPNAPAGSAFAPGSPVDLAVTATDERGNPVPAILWAAATNAALVDAPADRQMPTHFLLAGEVEAPDALEYADFLLTDHPRAAEALDHVLATQGWRRFVEQRPFGPGPGVARRQPPTPNEARLLAMNGQFPIGGEPPLWNDQRKVFDTHWPKYEATGKTLDAAQKARDAFAAHPDHGVMLELFAVYETQRREADEFATRVESAAAPLVSLVSWRWAVVGGLVVLAGGLAFAAYRSHGSSGRPLYGAAAGVAGLAVFLAGVGFRMGVGPVERPAIVAAPQEDTTPKAVPAVEKTNPPPADPPWPKGGVAEAMVKGPIPPKMDNGPTALIGPNNKMVGPMNARQAPGMSLDRIAVKPGRTKDAIEADATRTAAQLREATASASAFATKRAAATIEKIDAATAGVNLPDAGVVNRVKAAAGAHPPLVVREYAAPRPGSAPPEAAGLDDPDTVLWHPVIVLPADGKTTLRFHLGNSEGGYQITVAGHTPDGRIGSVRRLLPVAPTTPDPKK